MDKDFEDYGGNVEAARKVGKKIAEKMCIRDSYTTWLRTACEEHPFNTSHDMR